MGRFYDELAEDCHLIHSDWDASIRRQGDALDALIGQDRVEVLDCPCGIGTQAIGLALRGHRVTGTDLSPRAAARAGREAARQSLSLRTAAADMRYLPFPDDRFDDFVCADNSLPHLLTEQDVHTALASMRRVLRPDGLLLVSTRNLAVGQAIHRPAGFDISQHSPGDTALAHRVLVDARHPR